MSGHLVPEGTVGSPASAAYTDMRHAPRFSQRRLTLGGATGRVNFWVANTIMQACKHTVWALSDVGGIRAVVRLATPVELLASWPLSSVLVQAWSLLSTALAQRWVRR